MTINDLIERLENYREELGGNTQVRTMTQQNWPFENSIYGLCSRTEIKDMDRKSNEEDDDGEGTQNKLPEIVYIVEGSQVCYGDKTAWEAAQ